MTDKHTPLPWKSYTEDGEIYIEDFIKMYDAHNNQANAEYVLKAVNLHYKLIRLLKDVNTLLKNNIEAENLFSKYFGEERACNLIDDIEQVLKKAGE